MVPKVVSISLTDGAHLALRKHLKAQPILQAEPKFPVLKVEAQS